MMQNGQRKTFGIRGTPDGYAKAANPYTLTHRPISGQANYSAQSGVDENLRAFMLQVYNLMAAGLAITGLVAFATYWAAVTSDPALAALWDDGTAIQITSSEYLTELGADLWMSPLSFLVGFGPLFVIIFTTPFLRRLSSSFSLGAFLTIAALVGVSFSGLALTYTNGSIAQMFFATAAAFGGLSLYGYTTRKDLSGWGSFLWMGLFGIIAAVIFNIIYPSGALCFATSVIGVIVFSGFTAYDTQMIKQAYSDQLNPEDRMRLAVSGALDLYLDFINLFRFLLALIGSRE
jgi:uncharacterized protein